MASVESARVATRTVLDDNCAVLVIDVETFDVPNDQSHFWEASKIFNLAWPAAVPPCSKFDGNKCACSFLAVLLHFALSISAKSFDEFVAVPNPCNG